MIAYRHDPEAENLTYTLFLYGKPQSFKITLLNESSRCNSLVHANFNSFSLMQGNGRVKKK